MFAWKAPLCATRTWQEDVFRSPRRFGKVDHHTIDQAHIRDWSAGGDDFGPALRRNGSDAELGKMDEIDQNERCN